MAKGTKFSGVVATLLIAAWTTSAIARIQCQGDFQLTNFGLIATPYCEEGKYCCCRPELRMAGDGFPGARSKPKVYICQVLGRDIRLKGSCAAIVRRL